MSAADELRAAATKLWTLAGAATPGPWDADAWYIVGQVPNARPGGEVIGQMTPSVPRMSLSERDNAAFVAAMDPTVAFALGNWLDASAEVCDDGNDPDLGAVAVARAINGGAS